MKCDDSVEEDFAYYEVVMQVCPSMDLNATAEHVCLSSGDKCGD